jgi:phage terminase large subunit-like protein
MTKHEPFRPGNPGGPGRAVGSRNKLQHKFLCALQADFEEHGEAVIRIARIEEPIKYLQLVAGLMPKELLISDNALDGMSDEQLLEVIAAIRKAKAEKLASVTPPAGDAVPTKHRPPLSSPSRATPSHVASISRAAGYRGSVMATDDELTQVEKRLESELDRRQRENRLAYYKPYPKQAQFHEAGAQHRERLFMAGNRVGKTLCGAAELAMHLTGNYPEWWKGKRFDKPIRAWAAGVTNQSTRDVVQEKLLGPPLREWEHGTGMIPKAAIGHITKAQSSISGLIDTVGIAHVSGRYSTLQFKSYEHGREKWQGIGLDVCWLDEECPSDLYFEALTRTNETGGVVFLTFTPILGASEIVRRFLLEKQPNRHMTQATIDDALHFTEKQRAEIIASYPPHEAEARTKGIPTLGSGRIFPIQEELIAIEPREFPDYWPRIGGMDFGWTHNFAAAELVWDRDADVVYVNRTYRVREATPIMHAAALRPWGKIRWAWPRDGRRQTLEGAGISLADQYRSQGLDMMHQHAQFDDGSVSVEAGLMQWLDRMRSGRFKVFKHCNDFFGEFRLYHRKDGRVVAENDDLLSAIRYGLMSLRYARTRSSAASFNRKISYPNLGLV